VSRSGPPDLLTGRGLLDGHESGLEVHNQPLSPKEVEPEYAVDCRTWREGVTEKREIQALDAERFKFPDYQARDKFDPAGGGNLYPLWQEDRRVVSQEHCDVPVHQGPGCPRIQRKLRNRIARGPVQPHRNNDQASLRVKTQSHKMTAASSGSLPVYTMAECLGCSSLALR